MTFKEIKDAAFNSYENVDYTSEEYVFILSVGKLYSDYDKGEISKEQARRIMRRIKTVFDKTAYVSDMADMVGKEVKSKNFGIGEVRAVRLMKNNTHNFEFVSKETNTLYTIGKEDLEENK